MSRALAAIVAFAAFAGAVLWPRRAEVAQAVGVGDLPAQDLGFVGQVQQAIDGITSGQLPQQNPGQDDQNVRAALAMIRAAEGTIGQGGYGALFGWPRSGRSFDPYSVSDHPRQFFDYTDQSRKTVKTSASGAYQITWTTFNDSRLKFKAWALLNGYASSGFTPDTQDAFAIFLMWNDGVLSLVKDGRISEALPKLARRWASLPGFSQDNNPERSLAFVQNAYTNAGGVLA